MQRYDEKGLTYRENDVYKFIIDYHNKYGFSPTIQEISDGVITSRSFARHVVHRLEYKGFIVYDEQKRRSIVLCNHNETA